MKEGRRRGEQRVDPIVVMVGGPTVRPLHRSKTINGVEFRYESTSGCNLLRRSITEFRWERRKRDTVVPHHLVSNGELSTH